MMNRKRAKYREELPRQMYAYFSGFGETNGAPSFSKFARSVGLTLAELGSFRKRREFDAAWRECNEIRRDYLIDQALSRRFDGSFTKFIYALEYGDEDEASTGTEEFKVVLEVVGEAGNGA